MANFFVISPVVFAPRTQTYATELKEWTLIVFIIRKSANSQTEINRCEIQIITYIFAQNKGAILSKACDYIKELRSANIQMGESLKETERMSVDTELLRQQCEELKQENAMLRATLQQHEIVPGVAS
jgi:hypothetical protein